jgi:uncharacterized protein
VIRIDNKGKCTEFLEGKTSKIVISDENCPFIKGEGKVPQFILGFAGTGMVGTIVVNELIEQLEMKQIGYVLSEALPPITLFYDGVLKHPFRIYYKENVDLLVSICEVPFLPGTYTDLARTLMSWALHMGIEDVICIQGMADENVFAREGPFPVYAAAEETILAKILEFDVKRPPKGLIMGAEAAILNECLNNQLNGAVFLTPANPKIPTPEGAAAVLERIGKIYGYQLKTGDLITQGGQIKSSLLELAQKTQTIQKQGIPDPKVDIDLYS